MIILRQPTATQAGTTGKTFTIWRLAQERVRQRLGKCQLTDALPALQKNGVRHPFAHAQQALPQRMLPRIYIYIIQIIKIISSSSFLISSNERLESIMRNRSGNSAARSR